MLSATKTKLGRRIGTIVGAALAITSVAGVLTLLDRAAHRREETARALLGALAETVVASFSTFDARHQRHPIDEIAAELTARAELEHLDVFDRAGAIHWSLDPSRRGLPIEEATLLASRSRTGTVTDNANTGAATVILPLHKRSSCLPCHADSPDPLGAVLVKGSVPTLFDGKLSFALGTTFGVALFVVLMTLFVVGRVNGAVLAPLKKLVSAMDQAEEGDFFVRAEVRSNDEIGLVASSFNKLLAKITDLRVETIDAAREMSEARAELGAAEALSKKSQQLEVTNTQLHDRLNKLAFLYDLGKELAARLDVTALVERIADLVYGNLRLPEFAIVMLDPSGVARVVAARGFEVGTVEVGKTVRTDESVAGEAAESREPVYVADVASGANERLPMLDGRPARGTVFLIPLLHHDTRFAWLYFCAPEPDAFSEDERELFVAVARQAALALSNAVLFQETVELSRTDGLTGIANRRALEQRLDLEWSRAQRYEDALSLVMIDIDYFKVYNDQQGHQKGDEALRRVARILARNIRKVDVVGRYGGEEFLIALPRIGKAEAEKVANKLRRSVEQADFDHGFMQPLGRVTISCGVATTPDDARSLEVLIEKADAALFRAKAKGRNAVVS